MKLFQLTPNANGDMNIDVASVQQIVHPIGQSQTGIDQGRSKLIGERQIQKSKPKQRKGIVNQKPTEIDVGCMKKNNPEKKRAHSAVRRAVANGRLVIPPKCESCGKGRKLQAHHEDYSKPLEVKWNCSTCHNRIHRRTVPEL